MDRDRGGPRFSRPISISFDGQPSGSTMSDKSDRGAPLVTGSPPRTPPSPGNLPGIKLASDETKRPAVLAGRKLHFLTSGPRTNDLVYHRLTFRA